MHNHNDRAKTCHSGSLKAFLTAGLVTAIVIAGIAATPAPVTAAKPADSSILSKCRADLAARLKLQEKDIKLASAESTVWPNAALGMPETGKAYAEVQTPGSKLFLEAGNQTYLYTTSSRTFRYAGPTSIWTHSVLYVLPAENDPNMNGDLYQVSLLGTNSVRLASGVSDYFPQEGGIVVIKRRTSRSGHDILYVKADVPGKETLLYRAMDFGDVAVDMAHNRWAGFVKPGLGAAWTVVTGQPGQDSSKSRSIPLPEGVRPEKIAWSMDDLMILVKKDDGVLAFETTPSAEAPTWKPASAFSFPGHDAFVLNKSETLVIDQVKEAGKPAVEVARVWFTGDRNTVAKINDLKMQGCGLLGPYAFVWGDRGSRLAAYAVNISSGVTVSCLLGAGSNIKPFDWPPHDSPVPRAPKMY